ncbi:MAG: hypothetical protein ABFQ64_09285 [Campylobacterota bacterium]
MRVVIIIILMDIFIFSLGAALTEHNHKVLDIHKCHYQLHGYRYYSTMEE